GSQMSRRLREDSGLVGRSTVFLMVLILIFGLAAIEGGSILFTRLSLQDTADAAANAGAGNYFNTKNFQQAEAASQESIVEQDPAGEGGMATVWQATDQVLDRPVAVKILRPHLAEEPSLLDRFRAEALASARLNHPNIVNVFDAGSEDHTAYIVMELFQGETLRDRLRREGHRAPEAAVAARFQVRSAL